MKGDLGSRESLAYFSVESTVAEVDEFRRAEIAGRRGAIVHTAPEERTDREVVRSQFIVAV